MTAGDATPLKLLQHLQQALSHNIRTPLSTISNDLQYLRSKTNDPDIDRTLAQCKRIIDVLADSSVRSRTREALHSHLGYLADWRRRPGVAAGSEVLSAPLKTGKSGHFLLFSEAFNEILSQDSVHAPIADALCLSMSIKISGKITPDTVEVELTFPE